MASKVPLPWGNKDPFRAYMKATDMIKLGDKGHAQDELDLFDKLDEGARIT